MEQMSANERIIFRIGQSIVQAEAAQDQIRDLTAKIKDLEEKLSKEEIKGK